MNPDPASRFKRSVLNPIAGTVAILALCAGAAAGYVACAFTKSSADDSIAHTTYEHYFSCLRAFKEDPSIGGFDGSGTDYYFYDEFNSLTGLGSAALPTLANIIRSDDTDDVAVHAAMTIASIKWNDPPEGISRAGIRAKVLDKLNENGY